MHSKNPRVGEVAGLWLAGSNWSEWSDDLPRAEKTTELFTKRGDALAGGAENATDKFLVKLECRGPPPRSYNTSSPAAAVPIGQTAG